MSLFGPGFIFYDSFIPLFMCVSCLNVFDFILHISDSSANRNCFQTFQYLFLILLYIWLSYAYIIFYNIFFKYTLYAKFSYCAINFFILPYFNFNFGKCFVISQSFICLSVRLWFWCSYIPSNTVAIWNIF